MRTVSHLLHPPLLDEVDLASALKLYLEGFSERSNIQADLEIPEDFGRLPREVETAIFRIVQECLTNIHRHSGSSTARIVISRADGVIRVEARDDGKGISSDRRVEMELSGRAGVGLRGMRERVRQLGGSLEIRSPGEGQGTTIVANFPVTETTNSAAAAKSQTQL